MQNHILLVELNRHYCFDDSKGKEKKLRFSSGLTEYIPSICQLVKICLLVMFYIVYLLIHLKNVFSLFEKLSAHVFSIRREAKLNPPVHPISAITRPN